VAANIIDTLYSDISELLKQLEERKEVSIQSFANSNLRKVLLLSAASWFETRIGDALQTFSTIHSNGHSGIESLIKRKAIDRQYHTYFDWKQKKPGPFYSLFGDACGDQLKGMVNGDEKLKDALAAFLELGSLRNELVHENFAAFPFDKTAEEVYALYQRAEIFVVFVEEKMKDKKFGRPEAARVAVADDFVV
jgi:hypothetical protein